MTTIFHNGRITSLSDGAPQASIFDAGLQHGVGLFETMLGGCADPSDDGDSERPFVLLIDEHLERLAASARELNLASALHTGPLGEAIFATVAQSGLRRARVRLTVTGGDLNLLNRTPAGGKPAEAHAPTILIVAQPATEYPAAMLESGVMVSLAVARANPFDPFAAHKTLNYWWRLRELQQASSQGAAEALVFSVTRHLVGGCVSSALLVKDGQMTVPIARGEEQEAAGPAPGVGQSSVIVPSPVLPGITRQWGVHAAAGLGVLTSRRMVTIDDVLAADEVILTNSSWGVLPVTRVEGKLIGGAGATSAGPVARALMRAWRDEIEELEGRA